VWFYQATVFFVSYQMSNLMNQSNQKTVFVQVGINRDFVFATNGSAVISVTRLALVDDFQMHIMAFD